MTRAARFDPLLGALRPEHADAPARGEHRRQRSRRGGRRRRSTLTTYSTRKLTAPGFVRTISIRRYENGDGYLEVACTQDGRMAGMRAISKEGIDPLCHAVELATGAPFDGVKNTGAFPMKSGAMLVFSATRRLHEGRLYIAMKGPDGGALGKPVVISSAEDDELRWLAIAVAALAR